MTPPSAPDPPTSPEGDHTGDWHSRSRGRRVTVVAVAISVALHVLAVVVYPWLVGPPPSAAVPAASSDRSAERGIEVVRIEEVAVPDPERALPPSEVREPDRPTDPRGVDVATEPGPGPEPIGPPVRRRLTAAEALRPREGDPRLFAPLSEEIVEVNKEWLAHLRIIWAIEALSDSTTAAAAAAAAAREWTYTDGEGKKWGISPGKIHLGDITLPLPFSFSAPVNSEAARRAREDAEILRAAIEAATRETLEERARAIRERRDRERANGSRPDTTRGGGRRGRLPDGRR